MDLGTIFGIVAGLGIIFYSIFSGDGAQSFLDLGSFMLVMGGTLAATFINFKLNEVLGVFKVVKNAFRNDAPIFHHLLEDIVNLSITARREGILAIEDAAADLENPFMKKGLMLAIDGLEPESIRNILESEVFNLEERHTRGQKIMKAMGAFAPAFGMIGTLMGLIKMLQALEDPSQIGTGMALALVTTFYGALMANLVFLPIAGKLENLSESEIAQRQMIIEGILSIQGGENPRVMEQKLNTFIPPKARSDGSILDKAKESQDVKEAA